MKKIKNYIKESYDELVHKVTWLKYGELQNSSFLVLIGSLIFALIIGIIDYVFDEGMTFFYDSL